jgi:hypothetical protein
MSVMPMMPFIGVRISWLIVARKAALARLAASASSRARRSSSAAAALCGPRPPRRRHVLAQPHAADLAAVAIAHGKAALCQRAAVGQQDLPLAAVRAEHRQGRNGRQPRGTHRFDRLQRTAVRRTTCVERPHLRQLVVRVQHPVLVVGQQHADVHRVEQRFEPTVRLGRDARQTVLLLVQRLQFADALPDRRRHRVEGAAELADLVLALGDRRRRQRAVRNLFRRMREPQQLACQPQTETGQQRDRQQQFARSDADALQQQLAVGAAQRRHVEAEMQLTERLPGQRHRRDQIVDRRIVLDRQVEALVRQRYRRIARPAAVRDDVATAVAQDEIGDALTGSALVQHRLHRRVVALRHRRHQRRVQYRHDLLRVTLRLLGHVGALQAHAVAHQQRQHDRLDDDGRDQQTAAHRTPQPEIEQPAHSADFFSCSRTSAA